MATLLLTREEIDAVASAMAKGATGLEIDPPTAMEAARIIWRNAQTVGQPICSMATMFAEARDGLG